MERGCLDYGLEIAILWSVLLGIEHQRVGGAGWSGWRPTSKVADGQGGLAGAGLVALSG